MNFYNFYAVCCFLASFMQLYVEQIAICNVTCTTTLFMMEAKGKICLFIDENTTSLNLKIMGAPMTDGSIQPKIKK